MREKNITRILLGMTVMSFFIMMAGIADAGIANSKHDLSSSNTTAGALKASGTGAGDLCAFCHTPHFGSSSANLPLWNRATTATGYTMYNAAFSATIDMVVASQPQGVSAACLSCHDGALGLDQLVNKSGSGLTGPAGGTPLTFAAGTTALSGNRLNLSQNPATFISQNLTNDHPISITYLTTGTVGADTKFNAASNGKIGVMGLPLYGPSKNQVECGTCHNVHEPGTAALGTAPFLRASNAGSALCIACHIT
jgi:hypothetical protein